MQVITSISLRDVITQPCRNFNDSLNTPPLKLGYGRVIT